MTRTTDACYPHIQLNRSTELLCTYIYISVLEYDTVFCLKFALRLCLAFCLCLAVSQPSTNMSRVEDRYECCSNIILGL